MRSIVKLFMDKVIAGDITIDDVPNKLKDEVRNAVESVDNEDTEQDTVQDNTEGV